MSTGATETHFFLGFDYQCYFCSCQHADIHSLINHELRHHISEKCSLRRRALDFVSGEFKFKSVNFPVTLKDIKHRSESG